MDYEAFAQLLCNNNRCLAQIKVSAIIYGLKFSHVQQLYTAMLVS